MCPFSGRFRALTCAGWLVLGLLGCRIDAAGLALSESEPPERDIDAAQDEDSTPDESGPDDAEPPPGDGDGDGDGDVDAAADGEPPLDEDAVALWLTRGDGSALLRQDADLRFVPGSATGLVIEVDASERYQQIDGFGAQLHEASAYLFDAGLDDSERTSLLRRLFAQVSGIGLNVLRQPIGASSFSLALYTYDDTPPDARDFSIAHEDTLLLPLLHAVQDINPELLLFAAPWSAPAWMKDNRSLLGGSIESRYFPAFAEYLAAFASAYRDEGLPVYALSPQHEPYYSPDDADFPSMFMAPDAQAEFVSEHLAPALADQGLSTQIMAWDHNWDDAESYTRDMLTDPAVRASVAGTGFHCYWGDPSAQTRMHERHPDKHVWFTECSSNTPIEDFDRSFGETMTLGLSVLSNWSRTFLRGSLALDEQHGPHVGGCGDCNGTLRIGSDGSIELSGEFYALGQLAKFISPGATRVASRLEGGAPDALAHAAFVNRDGSEVLVVYNPEYIERAFSVQVADQSVSHTIPPRAAVTFHWARRHGPLHLRDASIQASVSELGSSPSAAIDGDPRTRWSTGAVQNGKQWLELDLKEEKRFTALTLDAGDSALDYPRGYLVQVSNDGQTFTDLASGSGDAALFSVLFSPTTARYVRIACTGSESSWWWSVHELTLHQ